MSGTPMIGVTTGAFAGRFTATASVKGSISASNDWLDDVVDWGRDLLGISYEGGSTAGCYFAAEGMRQDDLDGGIDADADVDVDADADADVDGGEDGGDGGDGGPSVCDHAPSAVSLQVPVNGAASVSLSPMLDWPDATDVDTPIGDSVSYRVEVDNDGDFSSPLYNETVAASQFQIPAPLANGTTYYVRITSIDTCPQSTVGELTSFTTIEECAQDPGAFSLTAPADTATDQSLTPTFDWEDAIDPDAGDTVTYRLQIDTDGSFSSPILDQAS